MSSTLPKWPSGVAFLICVLELLRQVLRQLRDDEPGGHGVGGDPAAGDLAGDRLGQADQPGLGRGVVGLARLARLAGDARHVDDPAGAGLEHRAEDRLGAVEGTEQVDLEDHLPLVDAHPHRRGRHG